MDSPLRRIDSHQHFWRYDPVEYGWISDAMAHLRRDFLPEHLRPALDAAGIDACVSVQARQSLAETYDLLKMADENRWIAGVVGWAPLAEAGVESTLETMAAHPKLRGVRHVLQDEPANDLMDDPAFNAGVDLLPRFGLVYDLLIYERHLAQAIRFVDRHPGVRIVLDHIAKPRIKDQVLEPWRTQIRELARRDNVFVKLSGMATEAAWKVWTPADFAPYIDTVLDAFGPARIMFGSDWPVMLAAADYPSWHETAASALAPLSGDEQAQLWGRTAAYAYSLR